MMQQPAVDMAAKHLTACKTPPKSRELNLKTNKCFHTSVINCILLNPTFVVVIIV